AFRQASTTSPERQPLLPAPAAAPGASRLPQAPDARHHGVSQQGPGAGRRNACRLLGDSRGHHRHSQGGEIQEPGKQGEPGAPSPQGKQVPEQGPQGRPASASSPPRGTGPLAETDAAAARTPPGQASQGGCTHGLPTRRTGTGPAARSAGATPDTEGVLSRERRLRPREHTSPSVPRRRRDANSTEDVSGRGNPNEVQVWSTPKL
ncbi:PREDICTED: synapsin-1-like, partial [Vollenhovia emeryi]|uniref:synapsin-1-like n=1 Tax=Vollenhovia emeryi TaxID=411798 RepID=UPI0005F39CC0